MIGLKQIAYIAGIVLLLAAGWWLDHNGYERALSDQAAAEKEQLKKDAEAVKEIRKEEKVREKIIVKWKTRKIKDETCHNYTDPVSPDRAKQLRDAYNSVTRSKTP